MRKRLKELGKLLGRHPDTSVRDLKDNRIRAGHRCRREGDRPAIRELGCIAKQVEQRLPQLCEVGVDCSDFGCNIDDQFVVVLLDEWGDGGSDFIDNRSNINGFAKRRHFAGFDF